MYLKHVWEDQKANHGAAKESALQGLCAAIPLCESNILQNHVHIILGLLELATVDFARFELDGDNVSLGLVQQFHRDTNRHRAAREKERSDIVGLQVGRGVICEQRLRAKRKAVWLKAWWESSDRRRVLFGLSKFAWFSRRLQKLARISVGHPCD